MSKKIEVLIVDDEPRNIRSIEALIDRYCPQLNIIGTATSGPEALEKINKLQPDTLFLDIKMPGMDGFDLLDTLNRKDLTVVFISAYGEHALKALKAGAVDYLLKPVSIKELCQVAQKLESLRALKSNNHAGFSDYLDALREATSKLQRLDEHKIVFSTDKGYFIDEVMDVIRVESDNNYVSIYRRDKDRLLLSRSLSEVERLLPDEFFFRIHNSHLINLGFLSRFDRNGGGSVTLKDGSVLPVSRRKIPDLVKRLKTTFRPV